MTNTIDITDMDDNDLDTLLGMNESKSVKDMTGKELYEAICAGSKEAYEENWRRLVAPCKDVHVDDYDNGADYEGAILRNQEDWTWGV
ncbi:MAG: hypothetical protein ACYTFK_13790 [Planctomycetota bacterium]